MDRTSIAKAKELRGEIIRQLYICYGTPTPISSINTLLRYKNYYSKDDIQKAIQYLAGAKKEFVEATADEPDGDVAFVNLTPTGINLAEGDISDMGVLLNG